MNPDCRAFQEKLSVYLEGELESVERDAVTGHLAQCSVCAQELGTLRQMLQEMKQLPPVQVPADFRRKFWAKVDGPVRGISPVRRILEPWYLKIPVGALATAAVVMLAVRTTTQVTSDRKAYSTAGSTARLAATDNVQRTRQVASNEKKQKMVTLQAQSGGPAAKPGPVLIGRMEEAQMSRADRMHDSLRLRVVLYAQDPAAADQQLRRLLKGVSAQFIQPPMPIHYEFLIPRERVDTLLERLKPIGSSMDLRQENAVPPEGDSPAQITVDVLSTASR